MFCYYSLMLVIAWAGFVGILDAMDQDKDTPAVTINCTPRVPDSALVRAAAAGDMRMVEQLLDGDVWLDHTPKDRHDAFFAAATAGHREVVEAFLVARPDGTGKQCLPLTARGGDSGILPRTSEVPPNTPEQKESAPFDWSRVHSSDSERDSESSFKEEGARQGSPVAGPKRPVSLALAAVNSSAAGASYRVPLVPNGAKSRTCAVM